MLFRFTDEQLMIQAMVREFSRKVIAPTAAERDRTKEFPADNLKKMAELGLLGMMVPPEYGGEGADTAVGGTGDAIASSSKRRLIVIPCPAVPRA